jgi:hypothetical protein
MTTLFFLLAILFLLYEVYGVINTRSFYEFKKSVADKSSFAEDKSAGCLYLFIVMPYFIWGILGVALSDQWISFVILFAIGIVTSIISNTLKRIGHPDGVAKMLWLKIDALASAIMLADIFMVHFRGDVYTSILSLF